MTLSLQELITAVQETPWTTEPGRRYLEELIGRILRTPCFYRSARSPTAVVMEINQQLRSQLYQDLATAIQHYPRRLSPREWVEAKRRQIYRAVLDDHCLNRLAWQAQDFFPESPQRRQALNELIEAIQRSEKLARNRHHSPTYDEAVSLTLSHVYEKIDQYDRQRSNLMGWVNYWLGIHLRQAEKDQLDPLKSNFMARRLRCKAWLTRLVKKIRQEDLDRWLFLVGLRWDPASPIFATGLLVLVGCLWLARLHTVNQPQANALLFILADSLLGIQIFMDSLEDKEIAVPTTPKALSDGDRVWLYLMKDPRNRCQEHIRGRPDVTFQIIALAYMDGVPWNTFSQQVDVPVPTLSSFYQRQLEKLSPLIQQDLEELDDEDLGDLDDLNDPNDPDDLDNPGDLEDPNNPDNPNNLEDPDDCPDTRSPP